MADDAFSFGSTGASAQPTGGYNQPAPAAPQGPPQRQPLGLPRGSVRAVMILMILGTIVTLLAMPPEKNVSVPVYLYYLLFLTTGSYFSNRGAAPSRKVSREAAPLGLPRGSIRFLIIAAFLGGVGWGVYQAVADNKFDDFLNRIVAPPAVPKLPMPTEVKPEPPKDEPKKDDEPKKEEDKKPEVKAEEIGVLDKINLLTPIIILGTFYFGVLAQGVAKMSWRATRDCPAGIRTSRPGCRSSPCWRWGSRSSCSWSSSRVCRRKNGSPCRSSRRFSLR
jgi:hypothetical protein